MPTQPLPFQFVGNDLALDFVNTQVRIGADLRDLIETPEQLARWLQATSLNCPVEGWSAQDFVELRLLRQTLLDVFLSSVGGAAADPDALAVVNRHLQHQTRRTYLRQNAKGFHLAECKAPMSADALMALLAGAAAELLASTDTRRIKNCAHPQCVLMFKDTSKSGRRRWCSMETCGNRTKVANFRAGT